MASVPLTHAHPYFDKFIRTPTDAALIGIAPSIIGAACLVAALEKLQQECIFHPHSIFADPSGVLYMVTEVLAGAYTTPLDIADAVRACLAAICG